MGVLRLVEGVVPLLVVVGQAHVVVLTTVYDPSMGVTIVITISFVWHYRIFSRCEAERVLVPSVLLPFLWYGVVVETDSCQVLLAGRQAQVKILKISSA